jgi:hypothetical protein
MTNKVVTEIENNSSKGIMISVDNAGQYRKFDSAIDNKLLLVLGCVIVEITLDTSLKSYSKIYLRYQLQLVMSTTVLIV